MYCISEFEIFKFFKLIPPFDIHTHLWVGLAGLTPFIIPVAEVQTGCLL